MATMNELTGEISGLREELKEKTSQLQASQMQVTQLRSTLEDLRLQMAHQVWGHKHGLSETYLWPIGYVYPKVLL